MLGKPKYKYGDIVKFKIDDTIYSGTIYIIDEYGTFEDDSDVSYDILVRNYYKEVEKNGDCLFKHINENLIINDD